MARERASADSVAALADAVVASPRIRERPHLMVGPFFVLMGGAEGTRTPDPLVANEVRYQLRHSPKVREQT